MLEFLSLGWGWRLGEFLLAFWGGLELLDGFYLVAE